MGREERHRPGTRTTTEEVTPADESMDVRPDAATALAGDHSRSDVTRPRTGLGEETRDRRPNMPASTEFTKLKEQVDGADQRIKASAAKNADELKAMVDQARAKADARADELSTKAHEAGDTAEAHWNQVQSDWDRHIKQIRTRIDAKKAELDADAAERDAEWAEIDAYDAVQFAQAAIEEAEYAVLDAVLARRDADVMAAAT
jgi:DNA repair exonuclease SbcCD ATPase subunit